MRATEKLPWMLIGTALDYRLRFYFPPKPGGFQDLIAYLGAQVACGGDFPLPRRCAGFVDRWTVDAGRLRAIENGHDPIVTLRPDCISPRVMSWFVVAHESMMSQLRPAYRRLGEADERRLLRHCLILAHLDPCFRVGLGDNRNNPLLYPVPKRSVDEILAIAGEHCIDDMFALSNAFFEHMSTMFTLPAIMTPKFSGGPHVGGADADMILGRTLIDIKTSIKSSIGRRALLQLIGYAVLDLDDRYRIEKVAIYQSRQGCLIEWNLHELIAGLAADKSITLASIRKEVLTAYPVKLRHIPARERLN